MGDLALPLVLAAIVLVYVSTLVYIRLRSAGASQPAVVRTMVELWAVFILFVGVLLYARAATGEVPPSTPQDEIAWRLAQLRALPAWQQAALVLGLLASLGLFIHLTSTLRAYGPPTSGASEEPHD